MMIELRNDFHNSHVFLDVTEGKPLSYGQIKKAERRLCGVKGCTCSGELGTRGPQEVEIQESACVYSPGASKQIQGYVVYRKP